MDVVDRATRSRMMSGIQGKNTRPEIIVRKFLHACGYRFRLHRKDLPGRPDIVLPRFKTCIFIHGCFWHHHKDCKYASLPKTRADFWAEKLQGNVERDRRAQEALIDAGWRVLTIWECELKKPDAAFAELISYLEAVDPH